MKVAAFDEEGRLLLIRNRYGRHDLWLLPGGGVGRRETFADTALRELREETGLNLSDAQLFASYASSAEGKRDVIELFTGRTSGVPAADPREVAEARFFALAALPNELSPATRCRIAELQGNSVPTGSW